jgi:hypothetical protein
MVQVWLIPSAMRAHGLSIFQGEIREKNSFNVEFDNYTYMSNPNNANQVLATLSPHKGEPPSMPRGHYRTAPQLELFVKWQKDGYQP